MRDAGLTVLVVLVVGAAAWALAPSGSPGFSDAGVRAGVLVILGAGVLGSSLREPSRRHLGAELLAIVVGGAWVLVWLGNGAAAVVALLAWLLPWSWVLPLRVAGRFGLARVVYLGVSGAMLASPWLVPRSWNDLPRTTLEWNPLVRLHGTVLGEDWFHGPTLYPRVGEGHYRYPELGDGLTIPLVSAAAAVLLAGVLAQIGRRYAASTAKQA
ncbi:MAG: hypothetical protein HRU14_08010 [Planctomycetes bacterium]|nr:hypothetical protein [Planctomycetota bacterium]